MKKTTIPRAFAYTLVVFILAYGLSTLLVSNTGSVTLPQIQSASNRETLTTFAVIGDFGCLASEDGTCPPELTVADMVKSWSPAFIVAAGDNNYKNGKWATVLGNLYPYCEFIKTDYCTGYQSASTNKFWPALGNHDCQNSPEPPMFPTGYNCAPHLEFFQLPTSPGNEKYYDQKIGDVHLFVLDIGGSSAYKQAQKNWLAAQAAASSAKWKFVVVHYPPYGSTEVGEPGGSYGEWQLDYKGMGIDAVFSGDHHWVEFLKVNEVPYFISGNGGRGLYEIETPHPNSLFYHDKSDGYHGALKVIINGNRASVQAWGIKSGQPPVLLSAYTMST